MFSVWVFVAQNICLLYLSISSCILMLCKFFGGEFGIFGGKLSPPDVSRINPAGYLYSSPVCTELFDCYVMSVKHLLSISGFFLSVMDIFLSVSVITAVQYVLSGLTATCGLLYSC